MRRLTAGLASLALTLAALGARAQTAPDAAPAAAPAPPAAAAPAPIPAAAGAMSVENTPIGDLLADPSAKAVMEKDLPKLVAYPGLDQIKGMTLRGISVYPEAELDDAKLTSIQKDLDEAKK